MSWCCEEFAKHVKTPDEGGLRIHYAYWRLPYERKLFLLCCEAPGSESLEPSAKATMINFCPWCGADLRAVPGQVESFNEEAQG